MELNGGELTIIIGLAGALAAVVGWVARQLMGRTYVHVAELSELKEQNAKREELWQQRLAEHKEIIRRLEGIVDRNSGVADSALSVGGEAVRLAQQGGS